MAIKNYRESRNLEQSTIEEIRQILLENNYSNVTVIKGFKRAYTIPLDFKIKNAVISIRLSNTIHDSVEVGSDLTIRKPLILIDLFCTSDGQRLDLKDLLIDNLKKGWNYKEYTVSGGEIEDAEFSGKLINGVIIIERLDDTPINFDVPKDQLDSHDRYRHLITLHCIKSKLED